MPHLVISETATHPDCVPVILRDTQQQVWGRAPLATDVEQLHHVSTVDATEESGVRLLDHIARQAFPLIPFKKGDCHVLQAPAGGGKTSCSINLAANLLMVDPTTQVMTMTFNKCAQQDGEARTVHEPRHVWRTIDSVIWELYRETFSEEDGTDLSDAVSVQEMTTEVLEDHRTLEQINEFRPALEKACELGDPASLTGDALVLYNAGLAGKWWSYSMLRVRAVSNPQWTDSLAEFSTILIDEGQDLNPVMLQLIAMLHAEHMIIFIRDLAQKLYSFMGCIDIVGHLTVPYTSWYLYLTYRYGMTLCKLINDKQLAICTTFPATHVPDTSIHQIKDDESVTGPHTLLMSSWYNILLAADKLVNEGRVVHMDEDKVTELRVAALSQGWTKLDYLFKRLHKAFVLDILSRINLEDAEPDVLLSTVHGYKGLEADTVRVARCVMQSNWRTDAVELKAKIYVAVSRAKLCLYLPSEAEPAPKRKYNRRT